MYKCRSAGALSRALPPLAVRAGDQADARRSFRLVCAQHTLPISYTSWLRTWRAHSSQPMRTRSLVQRSALLLRKVNTTYLQPRALPSRFKGGIKNLRTGDGTHGPGRGMEIIMYCGSGGEGGKPTDKR